jgi:hypothetical protein
LGNASPDEIVRGRAETYLRYIGKVKAAYETYKGYKTLVRYEDLRADTLGEMERIYRAIVYYCGRGGVGSGGGEILFREHTGGKRARDRVAAKPPPGGGVKT